MVPPVESGASSFKVFIREWHTVVVLVQVDVSHVKTRLAVFLVFLRALADEQKGARIRNFNSFNIGLALR